MKFITFFIFIPLVSSGTHSFITTYTGIRGQKIAGIPEFVAVTSLDGTQIDYYDNNTMKLIPKQPWIKEFASKELWTEDTEIRKHVQQIYNNIIPGLMERFNQSHGVHTYQRRYGCEWDDVTEESRGFDEHGYDGEDFISLDLKELRYTAHVPQATLTLEKWNNDRTQHEFLKKYYDYECVYWLKEFLASKKEYLERKDTLSLRTSLSSTTPEVSLLQKDSASPVSCHATGFYPSRVTISWLRNGVDHYEDVDLGELLPNEDGTFQMMSTLRVTLDDLKQNWYTCVVEHQGKTIRETLNVDEIKSNNRPTEPIIPLVFAMGVTIIILATCTAVCTMKLKRMSGYKPVSCHSEDSICIDKGL